MHPLPNTVFPSDTFFISFNNTDTGIYGNVTTALVLGQMERFYILNGDHRQGFKTAAKHGLPACLDYFNQHLLEANHLSEHSLTPAQIQSLKGNQIQ